MSSSFIVRFRPTGPWRFGPDSGAREQIEPLLHSDAVYAAVSSAMGRLGLLADWLSATATNEPGGSPVRFSSLYPWSRDTLFAVPPRSIWPPPASAKLRYKGARFVPLGVVETLLNEKPLEESRWQVDGESACLVPSHWHEGPFRMGLRSNASVDRLDSGKIGVHHTACLEFARDSGVWMMVVFADEAAQARWEEPVRGAFRLLADSGIGGERSRGWGRSADPWWEKAKDLAVAAGQEGMENAFWLLSVYAPGEGDAVDWTRGNYCTVTRTGRVENSGRWGELKQATVMVAEGSVLLAKQEPQGSATDVAPEGFPHPVYRAGFAVCLPIPWRAAP